MTQDAVTMNMRQAAARKALSLLDLTSLNDNDTEESIAKLCAQTVHKDAQGHELSVAAICIYPRFIPFARAELRRLGRSQVRIATVSNFPHGRADLSAAVAETAACVAYGTDEVDVVFPYQAFLEGNTQIGHDIVAACKAECGTRVKLKVILETGELKDSIKIMQASEIAMAAGADFIKTSTGKVPVNATPEAAQVMLQAIASQPRGVGFKPAGGVKVLDDALVYMNLVEEIVGSERLIPEYFRFGTSSLLSALLDELNLSTDQVTSGAY
ncbi:deoxyribose-phosphate aldolase [Salinispirillum sp. LH 10-3-1]|uniref:Deoxyribose-phosphate aldolase n=1 Tax=Salinispirillum sp. LH 10-3-1 TaxID=2952525 RepID=A0AB38YJL2_9GAMM